MESKASSAEGSNSHDDSCRSCEVCQQVAAMFGDEDIYDDYDPVDDLSAQAAKLNLKHEVSQTKEEPSNSSNSRTLKDPQVDLEHTKAKPRVSEQATATGTKGPHSKLNNNNVERKPVSSDIRQHSQTLLSEDKIVHRSADIAPHRHAPPVNEEASRKSHRDTVNKVSTEGAKSEKSQHSKQSLERLLSVPQRRQVHPLKASQRVPGTVNSFTRPKTTKNLENEKPKNNKDGVDFFEIMDPKDPRWKEKRPMQPASPVKKPTFNFSTANDRSNIRNQSTGLFSSPVVKRDYLNRRKETVLNSRSPKKTNGADLAKSSALNALDDLADLTTSLENMGLESSDQEKALEIPGMAVKLLPHQLTGVKFLQNRERDELENKGGFLCDEMGLGKTIQSLALILSRSAQSSNEKFEGYKSTLLVGPLALVHQWAGEAKDKAPSLRTLIYHGPSRQKFASSFDTYDLVVTTYDVVRSESAENGPLFEKIWWRIILDEAHTIKNKSTKISSACCGLKSSRRWCLTGTPIQNSLRDLFSLALFLRLSPLNDESYFEKNIYGPLMSPNSLAADKATDKLRELLKVFMLRRRKTVLKQSGDELPEKLIHKELIDFSDSEQKFYKNLQTQAIKTMKTLSGTRSFNVGVFALLLRLRQACDSYQLVTNNMPLDADGIIDIPEDSAPSRDGQSPKGELSESDQIKRLEDFFDNLDLSSSSEKISLVPAKLTRLVDIIQKEPTRKTVIFTQFTSMFPLMTPSFRDAGIKYLQYHGQLRSDERHRCLEEFRKDPSVVVLICSLMCSAVGLNLTSASRVIIYDPWWNPMIEDQAIDRVHRLGQREKVDVYQLVVHESIEERILILQERKRQVARDALNENQSDIDYKNTKKLSMKEVLYLLQQK